MATQTASSTKKRTRSAGSAVRAALTVIDPDVLESSVERPEPKRPKRVQRVSMKAIKRPNGEEYQPRLIMGRSDVEMLRICRERDIRVLLSGYPGCGKTALVEAAFGEDLLVVNGHSDTEVSDFVGSYVPRPNGTYEWVEGPLVTAMKQGRPLFVDDATLISPGVLARLYPAMDGRRVIVVREHNGEEVQAREGFFVVAAHNPGAPGAMLSEALASRFALHIRVDSDLKLAQKLGVNHRAVKVAAVLRKAREDGDGYGWAPEMRELLDFKRIEDSFGEETAVANLISSAPEEARDEIVRVLRTWYPNANVLALKSENVKV